jgi:cholesterol oxidase
MAEMPEPKRAAAWLAHDVEKLFATLAEDPPAVDFDVLIVGSGYGGAVAAAGLAGCTGKDGPLRVGVLERGKEYLPGSFPSRMSDLAGHVRFSGADAATAGGEREGLFDVRLGGDVNALVANGLGGGSLINAGVMVRPHGAPLAQLTALTGDLEPYFVQALEVLGAQVGGAPNTILQHAAPPPAKYIALQKMATRFQPGDGVFSPAPITVAMQDRASAGGVALAACAQCGDCATGCNFNAKESLDTNLLFHAWKKGAELYTGATVLRIERDAKLGAWCAHVTYTDGQLRARRDVPYKIRARKLILAAGTFGSTEILLRSQTDDLRFSTNIGQNFSSNGDMIAVAYDTGDEVRGCADENAAPRTRMVGPTITGMVAVHSGIHDLLIEDMAVPGPLRRLFEEVATTSHTLHELGRLDAGDHSGLDGERDPCAVDGDKLRRSALLAVMGQDGPGGSIELVGGAGDTSGDGAVRVRWPGLRDKDLFAQQILALRGGADTGVPGPNGTILPNPLWKMLPQSMAFLLSDKRGPLLTVHPLGGCGMGASAADGMVSHRGEVFRAPADVNDTPLHEGLVVLDGAILPGGLGVNPALTITALALRAVEQLKTAWGWTDPPPVAHVTGGVARPRFRPEPVALDPRPTTAQFIERMAGPATLVDSQGVALDCIVELSLQFSDIDLAGLVLPVKGQPVPIRRRLAVDPVDSTLAVFDAAAWRTWLIERETQGAQRPVPLLAAPVSGTLDFFHREPSTLKQRTKNTVWPWLRNRGFRDFWQWGAERWSQGDVSLSIEGLRALRADLCKRVRNARALASHAGEVRLFDYAVTIGAVTVTTPRLAGASFAGATITGKKRFTYGRAANPWNQLMRMELATFPGLQPGTRPVLELDTGYLVSKNVALFRILTQQDQPAALADVVALGAYVLRLLLSVHVWSLRKPDTTPMRVPDRLPGMLPGMPAPEITEIKVDQLADGTPVYVRLTHYRRPVTDADRPAVVMLHGYSASGTTFAHPAVKPSMAAHFWEHGRDVWIADLRTSSGMPYARHPWSFEDAALSDIPAAIAHVCRVTQFPYVDVVAHCMGAAMISMAILAEARAGEAFYAQRLALSSSIRRLVLSQVGPLVVFTQANIFRAYLLGYLRQLLPLRGYTFRIDGEPGLVDELIDRLLATTPYPDAEFALENPAWPWQRADFVRTRHRMDALYGRDFSLASIDRPVLDRIDDFFGPLSIDTVAQAMHFARLKTIANPQGRNVYVSRERLRERWLFDTMSIHGLDNGLSDPATLGRMDAMFKDTFCAYVPKAMAGFGHQDSFIGRRASVVCDTVLGFLDGPATPLSAYKMSEASAGPARWVVRPPAIGPVRTGFDTPAHFLVGAGSDPAFTRAALVAFVPVKREGERYRIWSTSKSEDAAERLADRLQLYTGAANKHGWMQFKPTPPGTGEGEHPDGVLMLLLYDEMPTFLDQSGQPLWHHPSLQGIELMAMLRERLVQGLAPPVAMPAVLSPQFVLDQVLDFIAAQFGDIAQAITHALGANPAAALEPGLLTFRAPNTSARVARLRFAVASCQYPAGLLDREPAFAAFGRLAALLDAEGAGAPSFLLLLGDQIYSDATAGLFDPSALDDRYVRPYEKLFANANVKSVMRRLPTYMMLDDHEIVDNWEPLPDARRADPAMVAGRTGYLRFQRTNALVPALDAAAEPDQLDTATTFDGFPFFIADTRTERMARSARSAATAAIMSPRQFDKLLGWLLDQHRSDPDRPKFIASPSILAPRRMRAAHGDVAAHCLRSDAWDGYPASMQRLLAHIARHGIRNVVFLSGDEHLSCTATVLVTPPGGAAPVSILSIHSSALYAPYPFANSVPEDLADSGDRFDFPDPEDSTAGRFHCTVDVAYHGGDGFAVVTAELVDARWKIVPAFVRAG